MARLFSDPTLVIASHNPGKLREIADLLAATDAAPQVRSAADHGVPEPEETADSFVGNAVLKARHTALLTGLPALADDSGLAVDALGGRPGIHSARYAERPDGVRDFAWGMEKLHRELSALGDAAPTARFVCALALCWPDGHCEVVEGTVAGRLVWPPRGDNGFGYDPMFQADDRAETFGEMAPAAKHAISHRADAFAKLLALCFGAAAPAR